MKKAFWFLCAAVLGLSAQQAAAKVSPEEASHLGKDLTPIGAEKAGSKDGVIPAWTGGIPKHGALSGEYPNQPTVDGDKPLFTITHDNYQQYADKLTAGHKELLRRFADYKMIVYPTRRTVSFPDFIYKATYANATTCTLQGTDVLDDCKLGFPFPIPKSGAEIIWNHKLKWRGNAVQRYNNQFIVQPSGDYQHTKILEQVKFYYANSEHPVEMKAGQGEFLRYLSQTLSPPRLAGTYILVHEKSGTGDAGRQAWLYSPGLKRIRRAPTVQYDNPYEGTDGNQFYDQVDMFNGALDRYTWKIVGKKEMYLPYNSDKIAGNTIKYKDLIRPHHLNQDLPRYELHRYWIVEADLKPGMSHTFKRRVFYVDEDSWNIEAVDCYDNKDQLYKFQEGHLITASNIQAATTVPEVIYDFFSGRYFITAAFNEDKPYDLTVNWPDDYFTAAQVQKRTTR
ncbi:MAG: DUF1329 domain-containing protein [Sinobacteraceae bacterium]|nr:DUF1329 domain-containing protein [Nevskiaceae bacterium]